MSTLDWTVIAVYLGCTLGLAGWLVLALYPGTVPGWPSMPEAWRAPMRLAFAVVQWCGVVAAFGFARRHLDFDHRWRAPLTEAVYPLYLVHQTVIILAHQALAPLGLAPVAEGLLIVALAFAFGLLLVVVLGRVASLREWIGLAPSAAPRADARIGT